MEFTDYIRPELLILIPVLNVFGMIWKRTSWDNKRIPLILTIAGIVLSAVWVLGSYPLNGVQEIAMGFFTAAVQGTLCAGAAVLAHQIGKQSKK